MVDTKKNIPRAKKAALDQASWMARPPTPLPVFLKGQTVQIYVGSGWSSAKVLSSSDAHCLVSLSKGDRMIKVYDARCIRPHGTSSQE